MGYVRPVLSQYRSHGYLFNPATTNISAQENSLNTVLTVISLIILPVSGKSEKMVSIPFSRLSL